MSVQAAGGNYTPSEFVACVLFFMEEEFDNDPKTIHSTLARLGRESKYSDLLKQFDFLDYPDYPYSPLLARTLNRLQEARLLASTDAGYEKYQMKADTKDAIKQQILDNKQPGEVTRIKEIAEELKKALSERQ